MATLTLTKVWVNRLDTGEAISAVSTPTRNRAHGIAGDVRTYAGGRQRAVSVVGERGQFDVTLRFVSLTTIDTLRAWVGIPVQIRDHRGQRFFGVFFDVPPQEHRSPLDYDVTLSLRVVTAAEGA